MAKRRRKRKPKPCDVLPGESRDERLLRWAADVMKIEPATIREMAAAWGVGFWTARARLDKLFYDDVVDVSKRITYIGVGPKPTQYLVSSTIRGRVVDHAGDDEE